MHVVARASVTFLDVEVGVALLPVVALDVQRVGAGGAGVGSSVCREPSVVPLLAVDSTFPVIVMERGPVVGVEAVAQTVRGR